MPGPEERSLVFFVREAFASVVTGTEITEGAIDSHHRLEVISENDAGGVVFGDGIESDFVAFDFGQQLSVRVADEQLQLVAR